VIGVNILRRSVLAALTMACLSTMLCVSEASAAEPWWHITTASSPAGASGGENEVLVEVSNLGDALANGHEDPETVTDRLPAGVTATTVFGEGSGRFARSFDRSYLPKCSIVAQLVSCVYSQPVLAYEHLIVAIHVEVEPGSGNGENEVSVSGGGAAPVTSRRPLALGGPPSPFGVESYELVPEEEGGAVDTQAGSHPFQLTTTFVLNTQSLPVYNPYFKGTLSEVQPVGLTKDLRFNLPPGLIGNPTPLPKCSLKTFTESLKGGLVQCPNNTVVGVATTTTTAAPFFGLPHVPTGNPWPLYSLEPNVGEPAKFGFATPAGPVFLDTAVRTGGDYGVVVSVPDITEAVAVLSSEVTFWGVPGDSRHDTARGTCLDLSSENENEIVTNGLKPAQWETPCVTGESPQPLLIMPTACDGPLHTSMEADPWDEAGVFASEEYTFATNAGEAYGLDGCNRLSFEPSITLAPDGQQGSAPTGLTVGVHVPQEASLSPTGLAESSVRNTTVALPAGVAINPAGADGLSACGEAAVGLQDASEQSCPESSKIGTVEVHTPLLPHPLVGAAYLAEQNANPFGSLVAMYIVVYDPYSGVRVKLAGEVKPDPVTGQLVSTFDNTPELPFEELNLHFFGGSRAPLGTPALCGDYTTTASIAPWSGNAPVESSSHFEITSGPNGGPCSNPLPFDPYLTTGSLNIQAGAFTPFTMTMSREDGNQNLDAIQLKMPSGLLGTLSHVKLCGEAEANAGTCGPESLIGHTTVSVGLGGNPYTVTGGEVFITGPYHGAPYGLSIVNPAKAGPFNLGKVVVRAKIEVNPYNAALTITSDATGPYAIPQILDGIPLQIKHVNVTIDRPDFTFNPTNCAPQEIGGSLTSSQGAKSTLHVPFQVTNCAVLKFKPIFNVSTSGKTSRKNGASLNVRLTYPNAPFGSQANIGKVKVDLPKQLPSRLTTLQKACPDTVFDANPAACPPDSRIGTATATTPVLPVHLSGPAYFVSHGGAKFPELIIALSGEGVTVYLRGETFISPAGITSSTFRTLPDVPIGVFELHLPEGPDSALAANGNLCKSKLAMPTTFVAANGMSIKQSTPIAVSGCPKQPKAKKGKKAARHAKPRHR
jgi:hypothetical protein